MTSVLRYSRAQAWLHWLTALLIFAAIGLGLTMTEMAFSPSKLRWYSWHKWLGVTVLLLSALRLLLRLRQGAPAEPPMPRWQRLLAGAVHRLLYGLLFAIPLSGWLMSSAAGVPVTYLGLVTLPDLVAADKALQGTFKAVHLYLNYTFFALLAAHIGAVIKHQWLDRDHLLARMALWGR